MLIILIAWSGLYNVAASRGHWAVVDLFLRFAMKNSVETYAPSGEPPPLDDADRIQLGAAHYHSGCAFCHGAPGMKPNPATQGMLPPPPRLPGRVGVWTPQELFWIVKNGLKYAGMPAWPAQSREDEVWAVVAFLRRLPALDESSYRGLAFGRAAVPTSGGRDIADGIAPADAIDACARCHGADERDPSNALTPRLHGQPAPMLAYALSAYASGDRASGIMQPVAARLTPQLIEKLSAYYASLDPLAPQSSSAGADLIARGKTLAIAGDPRAQIPPCLSCHSSEAHPLYPRLAGQNARYMAGQLRAWRHGGKGRTDLDAIMSPIARRLDDDQIDALSAYFSSLFPGSKQSASGPSTRISP